MNAGATNRNKGLSLFTCTPKVAEKLRNAALLLKHILIKRLSSIHLMSFINNCLLLLRPDYNFSVLCKWFTVCFGQYLYVVAMSSSDNVAQTHCNFLQHAIQTEWFSAVMFLQGVSCHHSDFHFEGATSVCRNLHSMKRSWRQKHRKVVAIYTWLSHIWVHYTET